MKKIFTNNFSLSNNKKLFDSITQFFNQLNIFYNNNSKYILLEGNTKNCFNILNFKNIYYKTYYYTIYKLSSSAFLFSFYDNEFIIYVNINKNFFWGIITEPERFHYDFFREFLIMPTVAFQLFFHNIYFFHSSIFSVNNNGILICGNSGKGKSTLTLLLLQSSNNKLFLSDDKSFLKFSDNNLYGGGFKSLLKVKNPQLPQLKNFLLNIKPELKINETNFYKFPEAKKNIKINLVLFPDVKKDGKTSIVELSKKEFFFELIKNSYEILLQIDQEKYFDFLEKIINSSNGYKIILGKDIEIIPDLFPPLFF
jgi:hypothetical protein